MVNWPGRGNRGKESKQSSIRKQRAEREPKKNQSMTAVASEQGIYSDDGFIEQTSYNKDTDQIETIYRSDRSYTKTHHLKLFDKRNGTLLKRGNPFAFKDEVFKTRRSGSKRLVPDRPSSTPESLTYTTPDDKK